VVAIGSIHVKIEDSQLSSPHESECLPSLTQYLSFINTRFVQSCILVRGHGKLGCDWNGGVRAFSSLSNSAGSRFFLTSRLII
jgi:hypothetical protein